MSCVCVLTDSTAQFTRSGFPGQDIVYTIPFVSQTDAARFAGCISDRLEVPDFESIFSFLGNNFEIIYTLTLASALSSAALEARQAASQFPGPARIKVVDTHTTSVGLGLLVQAAAAAISQGQSVEKVESDLRVLTANVYTLFCVPDLEYLVPLIQLSPEQAVVGEVMGLLPIFTVENGCLTPLEKVRTKRHLIESFQEFLDEFNSPSHIALVKNKNDHLRVQSMREHIVETFPATVFSEHLMTEHLTALLGPQSIALIIMEKEGSKKDAHRIGH